jgi:lipid A disaccharide synthetase
VLSSIAAVKHEIRPKLGTKPVNAILCRLPQSQKQEVKRQVEEFEERVYVSSSSWNSPLQVIPKKANDTLRNVEG